MKSALFFLLASIAFGQQNLSSPATAFNRAGAAGEIRWRDSAGSGYVALLGPSGTLAGNVSLQWPSAASDKSLIYDRSGVLYASDANLVWDYTNQVLNVQTSAPGLPSITSAVGFIWSLGGFVSSANSWQGINSLTDGALLRAYSVGANSGNTAGGYMGYADVLYPPSGSYTMGSFAVPAVGCYDVFGDPVTQPVPLNGLSQFSFNNVAGAPGIIEGDVLLWNGPSPMQGYTGALGSGPPYPMNTTPCVEVLPVVNWNGLNSNGYAFFRGGYASDNPQFNAITLFTGGGDDPGADRLGILSSGHSHRRPRNPDRRHLSRRPHRHRALGGIRWRVQWRL